MDGSPARGDPGDPRRRPGRLRRGCLSRARRRLRANCEGDRPRRRAADGRLRRRVLLRSVATSQLARPRRADADVRRAGGGGAPRVDADLRGDDRPSLPADPADLFRACRDRRRAGARLLPELRRIRAPALVGNDVHLLLGSRRVLGVSASSRVRAAEAASPRLGRGRRTRRLPPDSRGGRALPARHPAGRHAARRRRFAEWGKDSDSLLGIADHGCGGGRFGSPVGDVARRQTKEVRRSLHGERGELVLGKQRVEPRSGCEPRQGEGARGLEALRRRTRDRPGRRGRAAYRRIHRPRSGGFPEWALPEAPTDVPPGSVRHPALLVRRLSADLAGCARLRVGCARRLVHGVRGAGGDRVLPVGE